EVRAAARVAAEGLQQILDEAARRVAEIEAAKKEWTEEKARWKESRAALKKEADAKAVEPTFAEAQQTIDSALKLLSGTATPLVDFQRKVVEVQSAAQALVESADVLLQEMKGDVLRRSRPSLLSPRFYAQFDAALVRDLAASFSSLTLPASAFFAAKGWIALLQLLSSVVLAYAIRRHASGSKVSERWRFLVRRPYAAGFFGGGTLPMFLYGDMPSIWRLGLMAVIAVAAARLAAGLIQLQWRRRLVYLLTGVLLVEQFLGLIGIPTPLFRLFVAVVGLAGSVLCWWRSRENQRRGASLAYISGLRLGSAVLAAVFIAELGGYSGLGIHLLEASLKTTFTLIFARMLATLARGGLEFLVEHPFARRSSILRRHAHVLLRRTGVVIDVAVAFLALAAILQVWRFYDSVPHAMASIFAFGFTAGETRVTVGLVVAALVVLYGALLVSWLVQRTLDEEVYPRRGVEHGVRISVNHLIEYAFAVVGFLVALSVLGIGVERFAILAGAFGIGIGFGLQNIVNNFVSGLILLFERPIKVGDVVQVDGEWGQIRKVGLRATVVETFDQSEMIVPN
ncbi:MAG: mechanosensitive ion channel, partial [Proteobacteria bacterium]|nr:mechanosensitive ion channel [Pseudomonadota bacterium]